MSHATTPDEVTITVVETTDVHGNFFPTNYITRSQWPGSLARVATYVDSLRAEKGADNVILLDNGDLLQGQPTVYYYNFIDTVSPHVAADIQRFMAYDAVTLGNHDIETGHDVYDRFIAQSSAPRSVPTSSPRPPASPTSPLYHHRARRSAHSRGGHDHSRHTGMAPLKTSGPDYGLTIWCRQPAPPSTISVPPSTPTL